MSPPRDRESSAPTINPFELGRQLGEIAASLERLEARIAALPCPAHAERWVRLSGEVESLSKSCTQLVEQQGSRWPAWIRDWRLVLPIVLLALGVPQVRQCMGEEKARAVEAAVKKLEHTPAPQPKVVVTPIPQPIVIKPDAER